MMRSGSAWIGCGVVGATLAVGLTGGCEVEERRPPRHRHVVVYDAAPPPPAVVVQPSPPPPLVVEQPPPPLVEVVPVAPGPEYYWVGGRYYHEHDHWMWHRGYYDRRR